MTCQYKCSQIYGRAKKNETTRESPRQYLEKIVDFEVSPTHPSDNDIPTNFDRGLLSPSQSNLTFTLTSLKSDAITHIRTKINHIHNEPLKIVRLNSLLIKSIFMFDLITTHFTSFLECSAVNSCQI